jgi:hypothetical protein
MPSNHVAINNMSSNDNNTHKEFLNALQRRAEEECFLDKNCDKVNRAGPVLKPDPFGRQTTGKEQLALLHANVPLYFSYDHLVQAHPEWTQERIKEYEEWSEYKARFEYLYKKLQHSIGLIKEHKKQMQETCAKGVEYANGWDIAMNIRKASMNGYLQQLYELIDEAEALGEDSQASKAIRFSWESIQKKNQQDREAEETMRRGIPGYE